MRKDKKKAVLTGAHGLLGIHASAYLKYILDFDVVRPSRTEWTARGALARQIDGADLFLHFAALNRGSDEEVDAVNDHLTALVVAAIAEVETPPSAIVYSNSIHFERDTVYGRMKRRVADALTEASIARRVRFIDGVLPNVFGEGGQQFSNSVVSTFCYQLARGEKPQVLNDGEIELLHAGDAIAALAGSAIEPGERHVVLRPVGRSLRVSELKARLEGYMSLYRGGVMPTLDAPFDVRLFNTMRSYLYPSQFPLELKHFVDVRGELAECIRAEGRGQIFYSSTHPTITRGNHFHFIKIERFIVLQGEGVIRMRRIFDDNVIEYSVSGKKPSAVDIPTLYTHSITNTGSEPLLTLFWTNEFFNPASTDTYAEPVMKEAITT